MKLRRTNEEYVVANLRRQIAVLEALASDLHAKSSLSYELEHRIAEIENNLRVLRQEI